MSVQGVDHVQLPVPPGRLAQARAFYETLLGLPEVRDPLLDRPGTLRFSLGWQRLDLSEGLYTGVAPQAHIALRVHGLRALARTLTAAGHRIEAAPLPSGEDRLYVEDPFGNRLELIEPAAPPHDSIRGHRVSTAQFSV
jgi:catechol 2,3-dioxygenase-like lactoylglutathione lyase family enzyme